MAQTSDGYLWLGTEEGLARFDGVRFTVFDRGRTPAMAGQNVAQMAFKLEKDGDVPPPSGLILPPGFER